LNRGVANTIDKPRPNGSRIAHINRVDKREISCDDAISEFAWTEANGISLFL
jgi:hypothetical protein